jgi:hypothetical protein
MLAEFNMSFAYSCQLDTRLMKVAQYCLTMMTLALGAAVTVVTTVHGVDPRPIIGFASLFAGVIGGWFMCFKHQTTATAKISGSAVSLEEPPRDSAPGLRLPHQTGWFAWSLV